MTTRLYVGLQRFLRLPVQPNEGATPLHDHYYMYLTPCCQTQQVNILFFMGLFVAKRHRNTPLDGANELRPVASEPS